MALRIGQTQSVKVKFIATLMMVFALAVQPVYGFVASQVANAASGATAVVTDNASLVAAANNTDVTVISIKASFGVLQKIVLSGRSVSIDGNGNKLTFTSDAAGWQGNYVFQAYKNTVGIKNLSITGGDAAIYANGATVNLQGTVNVSGNEFGGIEVSQGSGVSTPAILNATGANVIDSTEANTKPTAWIDHASTANAAVNGPQFIQTTHIGVDQKQYYLNSENTGIVATNVTQHRTYSDLGTAVAQSTTGDVIQLNQDITVPSQITLAKKVTIDGQGHTVSVSGTGYRFLVTGNGTTLQNMNVIKTDKTGVQNIVSVQASDVTIDHINFTGQYAAGDGDVSRALEVSGNNFIVSNSSFKNLRQPAYINSFSGAISNTTVDGTKGWVVAQDSNVIFTGNSWGTNAIDIAVIQQGSGVNHYTCSVIAQIKADNSNPSIDNQALTQPCAPTGGEPNNSYKTTNDFFFTWNEPIHNSQVGGGALTYEFQSANNASFSGAWDSMTNGNSDQNHLTTPTIHSTGAPDGTYYWRVRAIDGNNIKGDWSDTWSMTIDTAAPAAPIDLSWKTSSGTMIANNGTTNLESGAASWNASSSSDVNHYVYKYWNNIVGNQYKAGSEYVTNVSGTNLAGAFNQGEGVHHFCVEAVDHAGNPSACTVFTVTYDKTKPVANGSNEPVINPTSFTITATDNIAVKLVTGNIYKADANGNYTLYKSNSSSTTNPFTVDLSKLDVDGSYYVRYNASDGVNIALTKQFYFTVDHTAPTVKITNVTRNNDGTYTITGTTDDPADITVKVDSIALPSANVHRTGDNWSATTAVVLNSGNHTITATSTDQAGNSGSATPQSFTVRTEVVGTSGGASTPSQSSRQASTQTTASTGTQGPVGFTNGINPNLVATTDGTGTTTPTTTDANGNVLGTSNTKKSDMPTTNADTQGEVKGASTTAWNIFGLAWYWWLLILAVIAGLIWWIVAARRRSRVV